MINQSVNDIAWGQIIEFPSSRLLRNTAHTIGGRYPCRSIALIPRMILSEFSSKKNVRVLDPFMGSGTTAIETVARGFTPFGLEVDPFARLISDVSVHKFTKKEFLTINSVNKKILKNFSVIKPNIKYIPTTNNIDYWFDHDNFMDLLKIKTIILSECPGDSKVRNFFLTVLADIIRAASKAERQSLKPYISKRFKKQKNPVFESFIKAFETYFNVIKSVSGGKDENSINWLQGDATNFTTRLKMDVAITSPPYINSMDYVRCIKLESSWIGTGNDGVFSSVRRRQLGEQARIKETKICELVKKASSSHLKHLVEIDPKRYATALAYFQDMNDNLVSVLKALKKSSQYHIIVGNSVIRGKEIETYKVIADIAQQIGFSWENHFSYPIKDHRTSLPRNGNGGKISAEHVITLRKR